jgi:photosystem II stability/assembly factor-like uncharacterized protein
VETSTTPPVQVLLKTTNGGQSWAPQPVFCGQNPQVPDNSGCPDPLFGVYARDARTAWAVGDLGTILATRDGTRWEPQVSPTTDTLNGVFFADANVGWAVGFRGTILKTVTGGR